MQTDFRSELYKRYDSTYKIHISNFNEQLIQNMWEWFDKKYLPLISSYSKESPILELGCGRGYMLEYLRKQGFSNLKGIDISEEQISIARKKGFDVDIADANEFLQKNKNRSALFEILAWCMRINCLNRPGTVNLRINGQDPLPSKFYSCLTLTLLSSFLEGEYIPLSL